MSAPLFMTGARAVLSITDIDGNIRTMAFATNVSYRVSIPHAPVNVMGRYSSAGHEPLGYDVSVSCGVLRAPGVGNPDPKAPTAIGMRIQPNLVEMMTANSLEINVTDRKTGATILTVHDAKMTDRSGGGSARDMFSESWEFVGTIMADEVGPQVEGPGSVDPYQN